jgi:hypothetical protein
MSVNLFDSLPLNLSDLRGADDNTLLRLYDRGRQATRDAPRKFERVRAGRAARMVARELRRRGAPVERV